MFGIEPVGVVRFLAQVSIAVVAATSFWQFVFFRQAAKAGDRREGFTDLAFALTPLLFIGFVVFVSAWGILGTFVFSPEAAAHEGVRLYLEADERAQYLRAGFEANVIPVALLAVVVLTNLFKRAKPGTEWYLAKPLALLQFLLASFIMISTYRTGDIDQEQIFFWLHNWHSVLTVGTVIVIDFLYVVTLSQDSLKRALYPFFPAMSAAIFIGLGIDFASNLLVFEQALMFTPRFFFSQTVVAILILNGALLAARINNVLIGLIRKEGILRLSPPAAKIIGISGSISIVSWLSITFVDFFELQLSYASLMLFYLGAIGVAWLSHQGVEKLRSLQQPTT